MIHRKDKTTVDRQDFIKLLANATGFRQQDVREVLDTIDPTVEAVLNAATEDEAMEVRVTPSIMIANTYVPPTRRRSFVTGEVEDVPGRFRAKVRLVGSLKHIGD